MDLSNFKELLIKKAEGNENLQTLIQLIDKGYLAEKIIESLEKAAHKGDKANSAITSFAGSATTPDINMLHDAISHHLSKFAAANKARPAQSTPVTKKISMTDHSVNPNGKTTKEYQTQHVDIDPVAHQHLERAMHLADLAAKASKHSMGKINFDHVPTQAWEMNETSNHQRVNENGQKKYADDQQGLKRRLTGNKPGDKDTRFANYGYLFQNPHEGYATKGKLRGHVGQYPFEEMKINDKHVHIDPNVEVPTEFEPHEFDKHPMFQAEGKTPAWERSESNRSDADREAYAKKMSDWHDSPEFNKWLDRHEQEEEKDPEAYAKRGSERSEPILAGVKRGEIQKDAPAQEEQAPVEQKASSKTEVRKPKAAANESQDAALKDYFSKNPEAAANMSPSLRAKLGI